MVAAEPVDGIYMHSDCVGTTVVLAALDQLGKKVKSGEDGHIFLTGVDGCPDALAGDPRRLLRPGLQPADA